MNKRTYQATNVKAVNVDKLGATLSGRAVLGIDIAKEKQFAAVTSEDRSCVQIVKWSHPSETPAFIAMCTELKARGLKLEAVMEPSGTYGDAIRALLLSAGVPVFRMAGKRVHDAAEVFDGVPGVHDAKAAVLIGRLHLDNASEPWPLPTASERELDALRQVLGLHRDRLYAQRGRLEALTARYWPELTLELSLESLTLLELLARYGGPSKVAADEAGARALMKRIGGTFLKDEVIEAVLKSSRSTLGVPMIAAEETLVKAMAVEAMHARTAAAAAAKALTKVAKKDIAPAMVAMVGLVTAATLIACGVSPTKYGSAGALQKAMGLNLREFSSGTKKGGVHISKRGDGMARQVLFLAALRLIKTDPVVAAWYRKKVARDGGKKRKAVVAVMRKMAMALWHVGRGHAFDATKLFDINKLGLPARPSQEVAQ